jgi:hypothetical protein
MKLLLVERRYLHSKAAVRPLALHPVNDLLDLNGQVR